MSLSSFSLYIFSKIRSLVILGKDMSVSKEVSKKVEEEASEGITLYCHHHITVLLFSNYYYEGEKQL